MQSQNDAQEIDVESLIVDDADNSRIKPAGLERLKESIKENGLIHPFTVRRDGEKYRVVAGFNRAHAVQELGWTRVTVMVSISTNAKQLLLLQISENLDREQFTTYEMARALQRLVDTGMTRQDIVDKVGRSHAWCSNYLGLFDLPTEVQEKIKMEPDNYQVAHVRLLHVLKKTIDDAGLSLITSEICGLSQSELNRYRNKLENKSDVPAADKIVVLPVKASRPMKTAQVDDDEETVSTLNAEDGPVLRRPAFMVKNAIEALARMGEDKEGAALAKVQGAIESLMWVLGDDCIPLFEDLDLELEMTA